jgi:hypothetical protein
MSVSPTEPAVGRFRRGWLTGLSAAVVMTTLASLGELFLRCFPPKDLQLYLGERSPLTGLYIPDSEFGLTYRSWEAFRADNAERLAEFLPLERAAESRPIWAMFGSSFVQAPGMLADTARAGVPDRRIFNLGRNEPFPLRFAQVRELLDHGLAPERVIVGLMPLDTWGLAQSPLASIHVTTRGALTYRPRTPSGPSGWLVGHSRLALAAWTRTNRHVANPTTKPSAMLSGLAPQHTADVGKLFAGLARECHRRGVLVTVIMIPTYEQIQRDAPYGFQDGLAPVLRNLGIDVCDPRDAFGAHPDKAALFVPDKHFSPAGNAMLLAELLRHFRDHPPGRMLARRVAP